MYDINKAGENVKKLNLPACIFALCFLVILLIRWTDVQALDRAFYGLAAAALGVIGISPLFTKKS